MTHTCMNPELVFITEHYRILFDPLGDPLLTSHCCGISNSLVQVIVQMQVNYSPESLLIHLDPHLNLCCECPAVFPYNALILVSISTVWISIFNELQEHFFNILSSLDFNFINRILRKK